MNLWNCVARLQCALATIVTWNVLLHAALAHELPSVEPERVGLDSSHLIRMNALIDEGIAQKKLPGCVVCIGRHGKIAWLKAYGNKRLQPQIEPMSIDTVFDMASITKPVATATSIMLLIERGQLSLSDKVNSFLPDFGVNGKDLITVRDLLVHQSGLIPDNPLSDYADGPQTSWERICNLSLVAAVGEQFKYSDVNFIVLARIVEHLEAKSIHEFSQSNVFQPLGMQDTGYLPDASRKERAAPTEKRDEQWMQGDVHDPRAYALGGVAGHAGLFSTAGDLAIYAQMMLGNGSYKNADNEMIQILSPQTVANMTSGYRVSSGLRGLGWDKRTGYSSNRGDLLTDSAFGHGGFTGTVLWIDPELDLFFIFLSNRLHPGGDGSVNQLAGKIANVIAGSVIRSDATPARSTYQALAGIDVLQRDGFRQLAGRRVGLITNHTGRNRTGQSTVSLLAGAKNLKLSALFSPEHGLEGKLDIAQISDSSDLETGLQVFSLYGETRRPTPEMLDRVDTLVFDIQDIGTRFYTYISTMGEAMKSAAEQGKRFVVLDRPNPINGIDVAGPMLDPGSESFVAFHRLPIRHGMTTGELASMFRAELELELDLTVIQCEGWQRKDYWDATGLTWVNPSPNMRCLTQALLYPGIGLLETTNLSVGRGTDTPFEIVGAPWLNGVALAGRLNGMRLSGVSFIPVVFTPSSSKYAGEECSGINILVTQREEFEPLSVGFEVAKAIHALHAQAWETSNLSRLLGNSDTLASILRGDSLSQLREIASEGMGDFLRRRETFMLYK